MTKSPTEKPHQADQWQPIVTAPKDGTLVDIWVDLPPEPFSCGLRTLYRVVDCFYHKRKWRHYSEGYAITLNAKYITHWMPQPGPPQCYQQLFLEKKEYYENAIRTI
ncbi:MAG TPA: hypothetical protein VFV38_17990 [Ktedonobacteraceae bacterium]|nr:hypothetical protein [Ktedonobacteraceae bacterium]